MTINDNNAIAKNLVVRHVSHYITNFKETLLIFLILRRIRINEVRLQNLYPYFVNIESNSGHNTG